MAQSADSYTFSHDSANHRFLLIPNGQKGVAALIDYEERKSGVLDLHHTEVPPPLQGRGVAGILTEGVMKYARENKYFSQMSSICTDAK